jgi:hypothetical protein
MSVPSGKYNPSKGSASSKIPIICGARVSDKAKKYLDIVSIAIIVVQTAVNKFNR